MAIQETRYPDRFKRWVLHARIITRRLKPDEIVHLGIVDRNPEAGESHHILKVDAEGDTALRVITYHIQPGEKITPKTFTHTPPEQTLSSEGHEYTDRGCLGLFTGSHIVYSYVETQDTTAQGISPL